MESAVIEIKGLSKSFGHIHALSNVSLTVERGQIYGLLGPNGAGKSTIIKVLGGEIPASHGHVLVLGIDVVKEPARVREMVGIIPEQENPPSYLTAEEYLQFVCRVRRLSNADERLRWWLDYLDFHQRNMLCKNLSRGNKQKLLVAQAFIHEPKLVLVDEPLVNMDPISQKKVRDYFHDFVKRGGTIFLSTHILDMAEKVCHEAAFIDKGHVIAAGKMAHIRKKHETLEKAFLRLLGKK